MSVAHLVNETLRLYPPTKRVYREYRTPGNKQSENLAADIEACHRDTGVWGEDAHDFRPGRWADIGKEAREAFLPLVVETSLIQLRGTLVQGWSACLTLHSWGS